MTEQFLDWRGGEQTVTASDLVRQFGVWQEAAGRAPVYILHRGRARLVLASVDLMAALCAPHRDDSARLAARERGLLDALPDPALIVDEDLRLAVVGRAARGYFGERAVEGADLAAILDADLASVVTGAARRVIAGGIGEDIELRSATHGGRRLDLAIAPVPGGALLTGRDRSVEDERDTAVADEVAIRAALGAVPGLASAAVGLRGYLTECGTLGALTGLPADSLASVRFVALFDVTSRVAVGDALEATLATGEARAVTAHLLVNRGAPTPVHIAISPRRRGTAIVAALVIVTANPTGLRDT